ncbi:MAG: hypothetical protein HY561_07585 [Gemmatimonadetes bacterium]|nr:hypothetical protein [Gemmatimonadota bacterium]
MSDAGEQAGATPGGAAPEAEEATSPAPVPAEAEPAAERRFLAEGVEWIARVAGESVYGTGAFGLAPLVAIRFSPATTPESMEREALLPRGRFEVLYDEELVELLRSAKRLPAS